MSDDTSALEKDDASLLPIGNIQGIPISREYSRTCMQVIPIPDRVSLTDVGIVSESG